MDFERLKIFSKELADQEVMAGEIRWGCGCIADYVPPPPLSAMPEMGGVRYGTWRVTACPKHLDKAGPY